MSANFILNKFECVWGWEMKSPDPTYTVRSKLNKFEHVWGARALYRLDDRYTGLKTLPSPLRWRVVTMSSIVNIPRYLQRRLFLFYRYDRKTLSCVWDRTADFSYSFFFSGLGVAFPVILISICYIKIFLHVRASNTKVQCNFVFGTTKLMPFVAVKK